MKWIGLAAIVLALLGTGLTSRLGLREHQNPSLPESITARIEIAMIVSSAERPVASIIITPPARSEPIVMIEPIRRAGSAWIDRGMLMDIYKRP
jgi:hypothetical protein